MADVAWTVQGAETKVVQNSHVAPSKRSDVERLVNQCIYIVFALQVNHPFHPNPRTAQRPSLRPHLSGPCLGSSLPLCATPPPIGTVRSAARCGGAKTALAVAEGRRSVATSTVCVQQALMCTVCTVCYLFAIRAAAEAW